MKFFCDGGQLVIRFEFLDWPVGFGDGWLFGLVFSSIVPADYFWLVVLRTGRALLKSEPGQLLGWATGLLVWR